MKQRDVRWIGRRIVFVAAMSLVGVFCLIVGSIRRAVPPEVAWAPLWPRPDGSVRSFGEVWDHPEPELT